MTQIHVVDTNRHPHSERPHAIQMLRDFVTRSAWRATHPAPPRRPLSFHPAFDVHEDDATFVFRADLPGVHPDGLEITFTRGRLTVRGRRDPIVGPQKSEKWLALERTFGTFEREFDLPEGADGEHLQAVLDSGVLTITIQKMPHRYPQRVTVKLHDVNGRAS